MFDTAPPVFAVHGDRGVDLFRRVEEPGQQRVRFDCLGMFHASGSGADGLDRFDPALDPAEARTARDRLAALPALNTSFALGDARSYPDFGGAGLELFLYHDFFRALAVAGLALAQAGRELDTDPGALLADTGALVDLVRLLHGFNLIDRGAAIAGRLGDALVARVDAPGFRDDARGGTGYALRMLGDLALRRGDAPAALAAFEGAVRAGDNPFRRSRAIAAALAAGQDDTARHHLHALAQRGAVPADLRGQALRLGVA